MMTFMVMVVMPLAVTGWYLWTRAADRFVSRVGFSVRADDQGPALDFMGGMSALAGKASSDTDILYRFIQSGVLVRRIEAGLDLRRAWSQPGGWLAGDPVFAFRPPGRIEDLTRHWRRRVQVNTDNGTGLIDLEVQAYSARDAQAIAALILRECSIMINRLSDEARRDATRHAQVELARSVDLLKRARSALTRFRNRTQIVDPQATIHGQASLLTSLQAQLAQSMIDLDLLRQTARAQDPRIRQSERRVDVIEARIAGEKQKLGEGDGNGREDPAFADLLGEYERLAVDVQVAERAYETAFAAFDAAQARAIRQSRYLAAHINPTLAESPTHPDRWLWMVLVGLFSTLLWAATLLTAYALKDRR
ncbi:capsule biosynthesis protein [Pseudooceanicola aestuarii]|uniref:capsule biosynthesis protein n=1 Tax=Pseudooceanicola aestuarii TaxID=2697319 RepID=UPI0013D3B965|nr:capsule biosynthesis protein [Pseudooceanicola aestuarii]